MVAKTVLIIEDDESIQAMLGGMLSLDGHTTLCAYDGLDGLNEINLTQPDLILLDLGLPQMDGESFIAAYLQTPPPHAPIIGMSGYVAYADDMPGLSAFLQKPFDLAQLRNTMGIVLRDRARI